MIYNWKFLRGLLAIFSGSLTLLLTGCGSSALVESSSYLEEYLPEEDYNYHSFTWLQADQDMVQTEEGYYFIAGDYLFFMDWETGECVPLCFKTDCLHHEEMDDEKITYCDAFLGRGSQSAFLAYYQERLYTICVDRSTAKNNLVEMNLDGSGRKILYNLSDNVVSSYMFMHRGVIYFFSKLKNLEGETHYGLNAFSVSGGSREPVQVYTGYYEDGALEKPLAYQNYIFFHDYHYTESAESGFEEKLLMYDIRTGETSEIMGNGYYIYGMNNGKLLIRSNGRYYDYSLKEETLTPNGSYDAFLDAHPQWQCHLENADEDLALFTCYDLEDDDFIRDSYVVTCQGEVIAVIPGTAWSTEGCYIFERDGEEYLIRRASMADTYFVRAYAKSELLRGEVHPITFLEVDSKQVLSPSYVIKMGD